MNILAQSPLRNGDNIVPNPGFENYSSTPIGWFYKGSHFTSVMKYWSSATSASPDVFGPKVRIPAQWLEKGFGDKRARSGKSMVGITVYGCEEGKPHCREYIQIQLSEPLVIGQTYFLEFWVSHLTRSLQIDNIGAYFSEQKVSELTDELLTLSPQIESNGMIPGHSWSKISGNFVAETESSFLIIGNFHSDAATNFKTTCSNNLPYAYYYVDDVNLKKEEPYLNVPVKEDDLTLIPLKTGSIITLKDIYFDTDKAELLPRSFIELNKLIDLLKKHPKMTIEIQGHTDNQGNEAYNKLLSEKRAKSVTEYLTNHGISPERTQFKGFGQTLPIADNTTESGRQMNRRVAFLIISK